MTTESLATPYEATQIDSLTHKDFTDLLSDVRSFHAHSVTGEAYGAFRVVSHSDTQSQLICGNPEKSNLYLTVDVIDGKGVLLRNISSSQEEQDSRSVKELSVLLNSFAEGPRMYITEYSTSAKALYGPNRSAGEVTRHVQEDGVPLTHTVAVGLTEMLEDLIKLKSDTNENQTPPQMKPRSRGVMNRLFHRYVGHA